MTSVSVPKKKLSVKRLAVKPVAIEDIEITPVHTWTAAISISALTGVLLGFIGSSFPYIEFWHGFVIGSLFVFGYFYSNQSKEIPTGHRAAINIFDDLPTNKVLSSDASWFAKRIYKFYKNFDNWCLSPGIHPTWPGVFDFEKQTRVLVEPMDTITIKNFSSDGIEMEVDIFPIAGIFNTCSQSQFTGTIPEVMFANYMKDEGRVFTGDNKSEDLRGLGLELRNNIVRMLDKRLPGKGPKDKKTGVYLVEINTSEFRYADPTLQRAHENIKKAALAGLADAEQAKAVNKNIKLFLYNTTDDTKIAKMINENAKGNFSDGIALNISHKDVINFLLADNPTDNFLYVVIDSDGKAGEFTKSQLVQHLMKKKDDKKASKKKP